MDPNGTGAIQALDAARFLKKSRLSDVVLSKIWDLSDPTGKGYLDKVCVYFACTVPQLNSHDSKFMVNFGLKPLRVHCMGYKVYGLDISRVHFGISILYHSNHLKILNIKFYKYSGK